MTVLSRGKKPFSTRCQPTALLTADNTTLDNKLMLKTEKIRFHRMVFDLVSHAAPCREFSLFATQSQHSKLPPDKLKQTLQFLENGRRGFLLVLGGGQEAAVVRPGDKVYAVGAE